MTVYYLSDNPADPNAPIGSTITSATTFTPVSGDVYIVSDDWDNYTSFYGSDDFEVQFNESKTATGTDIFSFYGDTQPTVTVADGVDIGSTILNADGDSLTVNIGEGATVGNIDGSGIDPNGTFDVNAGNNVTVGDITGSIYSGTTNTVDFGTGAIISDIDMNASASGTDTTVNTVVIGANSNVTSDVMMRGNATSISTLDLTIDIGDGTTIGGDIYIEGDDVNVNILVGNDVTITDVTLEADDTDNVVFQAGDNLTLLGNFDTIQTNGGSTLFEFGDDLRIDGILRTGSTSDDTVIIGDNWSIGGDITVRTGDDNIQFGSNDTTAQTSLIDVYGGSGTDGITVTSTGAAFNTAAAAAGWDDNGDGTWSQNATSSVLTVGNITYQNDFEGAAAVCFASGALIQTESGNNVPVEDLKLGDLVMTADHGLKQIRWINARHLNASALAANPDLRPIRIRAGALGQGLPKSDLVVSPQHRMLVRSRIAQRMYCAFEVLAPAKKLLAIDGIDIATDLEHVTYWHFLLDQHEVVFANDAPSESLFPGPQALKSLPTAAVKEIFTLFPELKSLTYNPLPARTLIGDRSVEQLARRHMKNDRALLANIRH